jgi:Domain of unknown function (DUF4271)
LKPFCLILVLAQLLTTITSAQVNDSIIILPKQDTSTVKIITPVADTSAAIKDSATISANPAAETNLFDKRKALAGNRFFNLLGKAENSIEKPGMVKRKDWLFYIITAIVFLLAILRLSYLKYFNDLFRLFFKTTLRQNQLREQMLQSKLSGLMFNLFFFIAAGTYLFLLVKYYDATVTAEKWQLLATCIGLVAVLYMVKYAVLQATGWVFGMRMAVETYTFIVFLINKVLGILLVPFIILLAFSSSGVVKVALTLSLLMISGMFVYRFIRSYLPIQNDIKVSRFHFFLYLCAFEVTPLLLIYKVLMKFF